ncbi:MAG: endolytic transglycosylase MltG [Candidatus Giovannonibacteria bacterium]|nr:MAG: endolytic transglycosylase MltG [Candidatus Giovannonibacteria bacterium]
MIQNGDIKKLLTAALALFLLLSGIFFLGKFPAYIKYKEKERMVSNEAAVTIPEGYSVRQIGEALEKAGLFSKDEFVLEAQKHEGYLFPDTYRFYKTAKPEQVIAKMRDNFNKKITPEILAEAKSSGKTLEQIIIMASLLEEEVKSTADRKIVAGILWKRLRLGMGLNVDAALTYVLGKPSGELTEADLKYDSSYNTYRYRGLPPGPISNPGMDAILAALRPTGSEYFYYLTDKGGKTHYAKTLEEHALNKYKYLK